MPTAAFLIEPLLAPVDATVTLPGSKSYTNRALACAALATGTSVITGALQSDDTDAMLQAIVGLGLDVRASGTTIEVVGGGGNFPVNNARLDCKLSGTTTRFMLPIVCLGRGVYVIDGAEPLRRRPMADQIHALTSLGARITCLGEDGHLPVSVDAYGMTGGWVAVTGDVSSQFLSGLLMAGPCMDKGLRAGLATTLVSRPYVDMTVSVMRAFGATVDEPDGRSFIVAGGGFQAVDYAVEPDASAASYVFAAAAISAGRVRVPGLVGSRQGDLAFVSVLAQMGCDVRVDGDVIEVVGPERLHGVEADLSDCSDTAQTLAAVAACADGPSSITGIGFIRAKETDRIASTVTELRRCGIDASEEPDGLSIRPGPVRPATIETYHDHRMAMSFALIGLRFPGISIADPGCVAKTFPKYWEMLDRLRVGSA